MRYLAMLLPAILVVGCSAVAAEEPASSSDSLSKKEDDGASVAWGPCAASRATILKSVSAERAAAIARGFTWLDADVPFDMGATHETYRTDCSGFISMCWSLRAPGLTTHTLGTSGSGSSKLDSYEDLVPADALVSSRSRHSVIFLGWNDSAHAGACVLEQSSTKNDMQFRVRMTATLKGDGFVPVRADAFANDTAVSTPKDEPSPGQTSPGETPAANPSTDDKFDTVPVCRSKSVATVCAEAYTKGAQCGRVIDNCGRAVDCTGLAGFGCSEYETCTNKKCTTTCTPKKAADLCYAARLKSGVECGKIPDGCGGEVDCDPYPYFGCDDAASCGTTTANHCPAKASGPSKPPPSTSDKPNASDKSDDTLAEGDPGDDANDKVSPSTTRTPSSDDEAPAKHRPGAASAGCSSSPSRSGSGLGGGAVALFLLVAARRRRSSAS
jgi:hypothetical protein